MSITVKYILAWFPMLIIAIANGALRDLGYKKFTGELLAHQASTFTLLAFFSVYVHYIVGRIPPASASQAITLGLLWLLLTLIFEFGFGLLRGKTLSTLLTDYNIFKGRLWILIPLFTVVAPYIFYKLRH